MKDKINSKERELFFSPIHLCKQKGREVIEQTHRKLSLLRDHF